ncbi:MAG TPA: hypothetical protein PK992_12065 [Planctomycetaceae bacterium]|nr:hypothetical protein [Planctomycetaceae bacterium]
MKLKIILIIVLAVAAMFALGWVSFQQSETETNIKIDTQEIREDTEKVNEKGKELTDDTKKALDHAKTDKPTSHEPISDGPTDGNNDTDAASEPNQ